MKKHLFLTGLLALAFSVSAQVVDTSDVYRQTMRQEEERVRQEEEQKRLERERYERQRAADMEKVYAERMARVEAKAAKRLARKELMGRGLRIMADVPVVLPVNSYTFRQSDPFCYEGFAIGANALVSYPLMRHWDVAGGIGYRIQSYRFFNSVRYNETTFLFEGQPLDGWRNYNSSILIHNVMVPIHLTYLTTEMTEIYFGVNLGLKLMSKFTYSRMGMNDSWVKNDSLQVNGLENLNIFKAEVVLGVSWQRFVFSPGVELFFNLIPVFKQELEGVPRIYEFGMTLSL